MKSLGDKFVALLSKAVEMEDYSTVNKRLAGLVESETGRSLEEAERVVESVSDTIDLVTSNLRDLRQSKEDGVSRSDWLKGKLDHAVEQYDVSPNDLIGGVKDALVQANSEICSDVLGIDVDLSEPLKNPKYEGLNKRAIVSDFQNEIKNNTLFGAIVLEEGKVTIDADHSEIASIKDYFEDVLDSQSDDEFKKKVSTTIVIMDERYGLPPGLKGKAPEELALIVDKGVSAAKVAYKVGKGELSPIDAVEYTIDRNVATLNTAITTACTRTGGNIGQKVGSVVGSVFGPAGTVAGAAIGRTVGKAAGYVVGKVIGEGVKKAASAVKSVVNKAGEGVKAAGRAVCNTISSAVDTVFGWFS